MTQVVVRKWQGGGHVVEAGERVVVVASRCLVFVGVDCN